MLLVVIESGAEVPFEEQRHMMYMAEAATRGRYGTKREKGYAKTAEKILDLARNSPNWEATVPSAQHMHFMRTFERHNLPFD